nr:hypothetical protein [Tanacetum cinerariifolium]
MNMSPENKTHFQAEKEAIHLILTVIGDEIYSTIEACQIAQEMWEAIERLQQGESLNIQDLKTNLFWEFGKFTSHDGETMESYYTRFYKLMNEMIQNNLIVATMQRTVNVAGARENVGSLVVQQSGIQCFNCKEFRHFAKECRKPKRVKDSAYHKEKMLLCKQAEQGIRSTLQLHDKDSGGSTADTGTNSEPLEQVQNDAGYNVFANDLQHSEQSESVSNTCLVETDDSNVIPDSPDMCENDIQNDQNDVESDDERVALANLFSNLKLNVDENKMIQKHLKKANTTLAQELKEWKTILAETSNALGESISVRDSCLVALQTKQTEFEKYKAFNDRTIDYDKLEHLVQGNVTVNRVYYVKGLNHNLFSVGQFCDADLEVAFQKSTCFVRDLQGNDLLTEGYRDWSNKVEIYFKDQLCSSCELSKAKRSSFKSMVVPSSKGRLNLLHMDLCAPMRVASINGKRYIMVIVDDYSRYTWTLFLRSKDETPEVLKEFLTMIQRNIQALVITIRTNTGT